MISAYAKEDSKTFNNKLRDYQDYLNDNGLTTESGKTGKEFAFNNFDPFYKCEIIYVLAFLLACGGILWRPEAYATIGERVGQGECAALITVQPGEDVTKGAINFFYDQFCLRKIVEKPSEEKLDQRRANGWLKEGDTMWYNAGIYIFRPVVFEHTARLQKSQRGEYELTDAIGTMIDLGQPIAGAKIEGRWIDVRDPEVLKSLG